MKQDAIDTGALFSSSLAYISLDELDAAAAAGVIKLVETDRRAGAQSPRVVPLSIHGLAEGIKVLRSKCTQPVPIWTGTGVPYVPAKGAPQDSWLPVHPASRSGRD
jgi:hypothetical protein